MTAPTTRPHQVRLHDGDAAVGTTVASFVSVALLRGEAAVVIATPSHLEATVAALADAGVDVAAAAAEGRYVALDAERTLATLRGSDGIDEARFHALVDPMLADLVARFGATTAYGEMVGLLATEGDLVSALRLEELWVDVVDRSPLRLLCGYPHHAFYDGAAGWLSDIHALHHAEAQAVDATWALDLPATAEAAPIARAAMTRLSEDWRLGSAEWTEDAVLVVAELVGNAVRYGGSRPTLSVDLDGDDVTVTVTDASEQVPVPRGDLLAENGRGYLIIDALSQAWGVERLPFGKRVWARLVRG